MWPAKARKHRQENPWDTTYTPFIARLKQSQLPAFLHSDLVASPDERQSIICRNFALPRGKLEKLELQVS